MSTKQPHEKKHNHSRPETKANRDAQSDPLCQGPDGAKFDPGNADSSGETTESEENNVHTEEMLLGEKIPIDRDPKQGPGRPRVLDTAKKARVCAYLESGLSRRQAAAQVGCHYKSVAREIRRDPVFAEEVDFAERKGTVQPLLRIIKASQHSWRAAAWLMKNHRPHNSMRIEEALENERETVKSLDRLTKALM